MDDKMNIVYKRLDEIVPYENNPRKNDDAVLYVANSIQEFGFKVPIVIDGDGVIVAGHTRYKAAKKLSMDVVPCIIADDLTPSQIKAFRLADNKTAEFAEWDITLLDDELGSIFDIDMEDFGFQTQDIDEQQDLSEYDDYDCEIQDEPKSKRGQIYQLGRHRLMCGDSTDKNDVALLVDGCQIDMLLTDPPYGVDYTGKTKDNMKIANDDLDDGDLSSFLSDAFIAADSVMKPGAVFYIWHAVLNMPDFESACQMANWKVRQVLIWVKNSMVMGRQDYQWKHEPCLYGWKDGAAHKWESDRKQTTVLEFDRPTKNNLHPTMKPVDLFDYQIKNNTKPGDSVLDLFGGSGTTLIACELNERNAYVMEYDPKYVDVIINRWEQITGEKAVLINE